MTSAPACKVYYDGACPVCRREIAHYQRRRGASAIVWVDAASCDEGEFGPGLDRRAALQRFHVREADGTLASGAAAFVAIWRRLPAFAWLAPLAGSRPMLALLDAGYALFLRIRRSWRPVTAASQGAPSGDPVPRRRTAGEPASTRDPAGALAGARREDAR